MHPHFISMVVYSLGCQSQRPLCLSVAHRHRLNTKGEISDRVRNSENGPRFPLVSSGLAMGLLFTPPMSSRNSGSKEKCPELVFRALSMPPFPHSSESCAKKWGGSGRHHGMCRWRAWLESQLHHLSPKRPYLVTFRSLNFISANRKGQGISPWVAWIMKSVEECENSSK